MPTAILSALPEEQTGLTALLSNAERVIHAGREFWLGEIHEQRVVLALSGIGKVAAATTATALIERFGVRRIVFTGVAGGLQAGVQVGDVVLGSSYVQHDLDVSPLFPRYVIPSIGKSILAADTDLIAILFIAAQAINTPATAILSFESSTKTSSKNRIHQGRIQIGRIHQGRIHQGLIASGDRFVSSAAEVQALRTALPDALCVEMEGAAVAQVCHDYALPFAAARTISDRADDTAHVDFSQFVRDVAGPMTVKLVDAWLKHESK